MPIKITVDSHYTSLLKAISWRLLGSLDTFVLSWLVTGQAQLAFSIAFLELFSKIILYWLHERVWLKITKVDGSASKVTEVYNSST
jgi:uncharacterized membrane protein